MVTRAARETRHFRPRRAPRAAPSMTRDTSCAAPEYDAGEVSEETDTEN